MSRFLSFVLADSSCLPCEKNENYKTKNYCPQRDLNPLPLVTLLDWRCNISSRDKQLAIESANAN